MAEPTDPGPVSLDAELQASLARILQIRGPMGLLKVLDTIVPVVSMGSVSAASVDVRQPSFRSTDVFSAGAQTAAAANFVHADTTALPAGTYDVQFYVQANPGAFQVFFQVQHRNAANAANLAQWDFTPRTGGADDLDGQMSFGYELALNERIRILNLSAMPVGRDSVATIFARLRT